MENKLEQMLQAITQRVTDWKKVFIETAKLKGITAESRWLDIINQGNFDLGDINILGAKACSQIGAFNAKEQQFLHMLPWYNKVFDKVLPFINADDMADGDKFYLGAQKDTRDVCFMYHRKAVNLWECYIVEPKIAEIMTTDILVMVPRLSLSAIMQYQGVACISFVKEIPEHFNVK